MLFFSPVILFFSSLLILLTCQWAGPKIHWYRSSCWSDSVEAVFRHNVFSELGFNKRCFWNNKEVLSSETYRMFLYYNDLFHVKRRKIWSLNSWPFNTKELMWDNETFISDTLFSGRFYCVCVRVLSDATCTFSCMCYSLSLSLKYKRI